MAKIDKKELMFSNSYILNLAIPLLIETILNVTIGMADTMMVASAGEAAVSGVSLVDSLANLFVFLLSAFATGGAVVASQYMGRQDKENASKAAKQLLQLAFLIALCASFLLIAFKDEMMSLVFGRIEEDVRLASSNYFIPILISLPFLALLNSANAISRSMGKSRITMFVALGMNIINISGNAFFIQVLHLGALGAGLASLISRITASMTMLIILHDKRLPISISHLHRFSVDMGMVRRILRIALPSGIENSIFHIGKILTMSVVSSLGTSAIAANAVMNNFASMTNIPGTAINMTAITIIGQCCGAGKKDQAEYYGKRFMMINYLLLLVVCYALYLTRIPILSLYNLGDETMPLALQVVDLMLLQQLLFWTPSFGIPNYLRAAGDAKYPMYVSIASMWVFRVTGARILGITLGWGLPGVCWAMYIDWYCRILFFVPRYFSGRWKTKKVI